MVDMTLEKQKIEKWLNAHPQLKMNIFSANIDVSFFDSKQYNKYRGEFIVQQRILDNGYTKCYRDTKLYKEYMDSILKQSYSSLFPSFMFYHDEPNIKASVYTIYLKYLEELDPKEFLTLRDFYTEDDDCYRTHMDMLTEPLKADYDKLQNDLPAIAEKRNDKYYFINDTPNQQYLGAFLVHLACEEFFVFRNISRRQLSDIIKRTFNCDSFNPNLANTILKKRKCDFDDKYFVYFPQDND